MELLDKSLQNGTGSPDHNGTEVPDGPAPLARSFNARPRDENGEPQITTYVYSPTLPAIVPFHQTALYREVAVLEVHDTKGTRAIESAYEDLMRAVKVVMQVREEEAILLPARIREAVAANDAIERQKRALEELRAKAIELWNDAHAAAEQELQQSQNEAVTAVAKVPGNSYDANQPGEFKTQSPRETLPRSDRRGIGAAVSAPGRAGSALSLAGVGANGYRWHRLRPELRSGTPPGSD